MSGITKKDGKCMTDVLLVYEEPTFTTKFKAYFQTVGCPVIHAEKIAKAYDIIKNESIEILIVDCDEDYDAAFKLFYRVKKDPEKKKMFIVALSAAEERFGILLRAETKQEKKWLNVDLFINKPISPKSLYLLIKKEIAILEGIDTTDLDSSNPEE